MKICFSRCWRLTTILALLILADGVFWPQPATAQSVSKDALLRNLVRDVIVPGYQELASRSRDLTNSLALLANAPSEESLAKARQAWVSALLASRQIQWVQTGPIADREYLATFYYFKVLPGRMEMVLTNSRPVDGALLEEYGATARGMFALEYLLFNAPVPRPAGGTPPVATTLARFSGAEGARHHQYAQALAHDLVTKASQLAADWTASSEQSAAARFISGGQQSVNLLVNQIAQFVEQIVEQRLNFVLLLPAPIEQQLDRIEGNRSGTSQRSLVAQFQGVQKVFHAPNGGRLDGYVRSLSEPVATRLKQSFEASIAILQDLGVPLEQLLPDKTASVQKAYEQTRQLEVLLKTDLASVLGVTLTFNSTDGD